MRVELRESLPLLLHASVFKIAIYSITALNIPRDCLVFENAKLANHSCSFDSDMLGSRVFLFVRYFYMFSSIFFFTLFLCFLCMPAVSLVNSVRTMTSTAFDDATVRSLFLKISCYITSFVSMRRRQAQAMTLHLAAATQYALFIHNLISFTFSIYFQAFVQQRLLRVSPSHSPIASDGDVETTLQLQYRAYTTRFYILFLFSMFSFTQVSRFWLFCLFSFFAHVSFCIAVFDLSLILADI